MYDYKLKCPAYIEFSKKDGTCGKGVWLVADQDKYYIELHDEDAIIIVSKRSIKIYEPDRNNWPRWVYG